MVEEHGIMYNSWFWNNLRLIALSSNTDFIKIQLHQPEKRDENGERLVPSSLWKCRNEQPELKVHFALDGSRRFKLILPLLSSIWQSCKNV
jgi:hypothetical protein